jgi:hypothetical protein
MEQPDSVQINHRGCDARWICQPVRLVLVFLVAVIYAVAFPVLCLVGQSCCIFFSLMIVVLMGIDVGVAGGLLAIVDCRADSLSFQVHAGVQPLDELNTVGQA